MYVSQCLGVYHTLCEVVKNSPSDVISRFLPDFFQAARSLLNSTLCTNASIRKLRIKILSRAALRLLPVRPRVSLRKGQRSWFALKRGANEVRKVVSCT
jgi:hypothetical protein